MRKAIAFSAAISVFLLYAPGAFAQYLRLPPVVKGPEIDPSLLGSGLALTVSGALLLIERYRARRPVK